MELAKIAKKTLISTLMGWVAQTKINDSLHPDGVFIMYFDEGTLQINLSNLSRPYRKKHIEPNLSKYALSFIQHITPTLVQWSQKHNIQSIEMNFRFKTEEEVHSVKRIIKAKKIDREAQEYLDNKST